MSSLDGLDGRVFAFFFCGEPFFNARFAVKKARTACWRDGGDGGGVELGIIGIGIPWLLSRDTRVCGRGGERITLCFAVVSCSDAGDGAMDGVDCGTNVLSTGGLVRGSSWRIA